MSGYASWQRHDQGLIGATGVVELVARWRGGNASTRKEDPYARVP